MSSTNASADMRQNFQSSDFQSRKQPVESFLMLETTQSRKKSSAENADADSLSPDNMYGKIYESLFTGSMVGSGPAVFAVWSYVIANTKPDSLVELNPIILSTVIGAKTKEIEAAIEFLCSPDSKSRSKQYEGRRMVKKGEFLFFIPRYEHYRGLPNDAARKLYFRDKQREHRERVADGQTGMLNLSNKQKHKAEAVSRSKGKPLSFEEVERYAAQIGIAKTDAEGFFDSQESGGWKRNGKPLADWKAALRNWKRSGWLISQKQHGRNSTTAKKEEKIEWTN